MKKALIILSVVLVLAGIIFGLFYFFWTPENFATLGRRAMEDGRYSRAVSRYEKAVDLDPGNVDYVLALADACIADGSYTKAERSLVTAIRNAPSTPLFCKLSSVYVAQDKLLDAQKMLDNITDPTVRAEIDAMRPAAPTLSPDGGEYSEYITVTISGEGGDIYYSMDEQYPSTSTAAYTEPIALPAGQSHLSAVLVGSNGLVSPLVEADYQIVGVIEEVVFSSPELESYIRDMLYVARTETIMTDLLWQVTELTVPEEVTNYDDLRYFTGLTSLTIHDSMVEDYSFLSALTELTTLDLSGCLLSSDTVSLIGTLSKLETLNLSGCGISGIQALGNLSALSALDLSENSISDISALSDCKQLVSVNLRNNAVSSLSALSKMNLLAELDITGNRVSSLAALEGCGKLETLKAEDNQITDITPLGKLTKLGTLLLSDNEIADASVLSSCTMLSRLELANNQLTAIDALSALNRLTYLDIGHNQVTALPTLQAGASLQQFYAPYNQLEDISMLAGLPELTYVDVDYNEALEDVVCLASCPLLVQVNAFGTQVKEVTDLTQIGVIVNYNPVEDEEA